MPTSLLIRIFVTVGGASVSFNLQSSNTPFRLKLQLWGLVCMHAATFPHLKHPPFELTLAMNI